MKTFEAKKIAQILSDLPKGKREKEIYQILICGKYAQFITTEIIKDLTNQKN